MENTIHRAYIHIGNQLKKEIEQGIYKIGEKLPTEREISERFNISRTIVREAIVMLEVEKLVTVKKGSGVYIINTPNADNTEKDNGLSTDDVGPFELLQARQLIESSIAEFAAQQATKKDIIRLKFLLAKERKLLEEDESDYSADKEFHLALAEITQNDVLVKIHNDLWEYRNNAMWSQLHMRILKNDYRKLWLVDHENILNAIQRKDPALARKAMWQHLENVRIKLFELSDVEDPKFDGYLFNINPVAVGI